MSDAAHPKIPTPLSADLFMEYLTEKKVTNKGCPQCGYIGWTLVDMDNLRGLVLYGLDDEGAVKTEFMPTIPLICKRCAYLWLTVRGPVEDWLKERQDRDQ